MESIQTTTTKKKNTGQIGFILSVLVLPALFLTVFSCLFGPLSFVLFCISTFCCIHGLIKRRSQKLATTGLLVNIATMILLFFIFITFTPPGSVPYPLNIYKFKRACAEADFWLDFDSSNMEELKSGVSFLSPYASIYFKGDSGQYTKKAVIAFAEKNGWKYHLSIPITSENLHLFDKNNEDEYEFQAYITCSNPIPIPFSTGDNLLVFETRNYLGYASFALLSDNENKLSVFYRYPTLPDPRQDFWLPELFYELSEKENKEN